MTTNGIITQFVLPDLFSNLPYPLQKGHHFEEQAREAEEFILDTLGYTGEKRAAIVSAKFTEFVEYVYPVADPVRHRTALEFIIWSFVIDDWMDVSDPVLARQHAQACFNVILDPGLQPAADDAMAILTKGTFFTSSIRYNLVSIVMKEKNYGLQEAVDYIGQRCNACIDTFEHHLKQLPSWDSETDEAVAKYILAMKNWMSGVLHWSFISERYFGKDGEEVKKHRIVKLHPNLIKELNGL